MQSRHSSWLTLAVGCLGFALAAVQPIYSAEPAVEFLAGLRAREYFETATDYLERIGKTKLVTPEFKESIPYERGITLIESSRIQRDPGLREKQLDDAQVTLNGFIATAGSSPRGRDAKTQLGNVMLERARVKVSRAAKPNIPADEKNLFMTDGRKLYDDARTAMESLKVELSKEKEKIGNAPSDTLPPDTAALREQLRISLIQVQMLLAQVHVEKAETVKENKVEYEKLLMTAAGEFNSVYQDYRTRLAGMYARMLQGKCYQQLGTVQGRKEALSFYTDLLDQPDDAAFRPLKTQVLKLAMDCWLHDNLQREAISNGENWINVVRPSPRELADEDWLEIRLSLAKAYKIESDSLKSTDPKRTQMRTSATRLLRSIAQVKGPYEQEAERLLKELGGAGPATSDKRIDPKDFAEARDFGKAALDQFETAKPVVADLRKQLAAPELSAKDKEELEARIATAERPLQDAIFYLRDALRLADREIPDSEINVTQYYLCYLYYTAGDYHSAAVLGAFVAARYPNSSGGASCSEIALASYQQLYFKSPPDARKFEARQLAKLCQTITQKWPGDPRAVKAFTVMIPLLVEDGRLEEARENLQYLPAESDARGPVELMTGQAMWRSFLIQLSALRKAQNSDKPPTSDEVTTKELELERLKVAAKAVLNDGIARMQKLELTDKKAASMPFAMLHLSQIYVDTGEPAQAIAILEDQKYGPLTLLNRNDASLADKPGFAGEAYKAALRAYIASLPQSPNAKMTLAKADQIMTKLMASYGNSPEERKRLVTIFVTLAQELKDLVELAKPTDRAPLMEGFEKFLKQVAEASTEVPVRNWVGDTFRNMAEAAATPGSQGKLSKEQIRYYNSACAEWEKLLAEDAKNPNYITPEGEFQLRLQLARTYTQMHTFPEAMNEYATILKERPMALNVQVEAAETFMLRGRSGDPNYFLLAMRGASEGMVKDAQGVEHSQNIIWGWAKLGKITDKKEQFHDIFYLAWLRQAEAAYEYAMTATKPADRKKFLEVSRGNILGLNQGWPSLGGPAMRKQYDDLLRKVQTELKQPVTGLPIVNKSTDPAPAPMTTKPAPMPTPAATPTAAK